MARSHVTAYRAGADHLGRDGPPQYYLLDALSMTVSIIRPPVPVPVPVHARAFFRSSRAGYGPILERAEHGLVREGVGTR